MRKIFKTVAALAAVVLAGCTNDLTNEVVAPVGGTTVVGVGFDQTKTYLGELVDGARKVYWSKGDQIAINGKASASSEISENARYAEFSFNAVLNRPYSVLYPASAYVDAQTIKLTAVQEAAEGTFATNCAPMACYAGEGDALKLHHLAAVVHLQVKLPAENAHDAHTLAKVEFRGKAGEQVSGNFTINYAEATLAATSEAEADKVVTTKVDKALSAEATDIYVVVPAGEYAEGFTVRLIDEAGHYMDIATKNIELTKGDVKAMPAFDFVPTGTLAGVNIASAEEWNTFVAKYNNGDYADVENLTVNITADLVFDETTSKNFAPIGAFSGVFDGGNHAIKGLVAKASIFNKVLENSVVKNLTIDSSCALTADKDLWYFGSITRENFGTIENCTNYANISLEVDTWGHNTYIGGLVGSNSFVLTNSKNYGNIVYGDGLSISKKEHYVGGLVATNNGGTISVCENYGAITLAGINDGSKVNRIGGIAGYSSNAISNCVNSGAISSSFIATYLYVGGIVGQIGTNTEADIIGNTNNGSISFGANAYIDRVVIGGILGNAEGTSSKIESNTNNGSVTFDTDDTVDEAGATVITTAKYVYLGGVLGWMAGAHSGTFKNNSATNKVVVNCTGNGQYTGIGGLVGASNGNAVIDLSGDTGVIAPTVKGGSSAGNSNHVGIGGIVGFLNGTITIKNVTNWTGKLQIDIIAKNNTSCAAFGAILGYTSNGVTIDNCTPAGTFEFVNRNQDKLNGKLAIGGILGLCKGACSVSNCTNNSALNWGFSSKQNNSNPCMIGGIVGWCDANNNLTITNCHNTAYIYNRAYNNNRAVSNANYAGGIIGNFGNGTTGGALTITNCTNTAIVQSTRGAVAGIAGYARNATISICSSDKDISPVGFAGGIVAEAKDVNITSCTVTGKITGATGGGIQNSSGGIVGYMDGTSTVDDCKYFGAVTIANTSPGYYGGITGWASGNSTIKNCKFGGSVNGVAISSDNCADYVANKNNGNGTPVVTTPTLTNNSYWDGK